MTVRELEHEGLPAIELTDRHTRIVVVHGVGPRIAWFGGAGRDNLLFWDSAHDHTRGAWQLRGGHRLWTTRPGADESEETYTPDNAPCRVRSARDRVVVTAPRDASGLEKTLAIAARDGGWTIEHRIRNAGDMLWSGGAWALTCTLPRRASYEIPLDGGNPAWDVVRVVYPRRWGGGHTSRLADPQFVLDDARLRIRPTGREGKRMLLAPRGELVMRDPVRGTFAKRSRYQPEARYPLGCNVAVYLGPRRFMVELETMGPLATLAPGDVIRHVEHWTYRSPVRSVHRR